MKNSTCEHLFGREFAGRAKVQSGFLYPCGEAGPHLAFLKSAEFAQCSIGTHLLSRKLSSQEKIWFSPDLSVVEFSLFEYDHEKFLIMEDVSDTKPSRDESVRSVISGYTSQRKRPAIGGDTSQRKRPVISGDTSHRQQTDAITLDSCLKELAPFDQKIFMAKYRDRFMEFVPADAIVSKWEVYDIIDINTYDEVKKVPPGDKRSILFRYIRENGSLHTIRKMSDFLIETGEHGYPHVKSLGEDMREDLNNYS